MNVLKSCYQFELCSKYDKEHDFDVILGKVVPCRELSWICRKHSNNVMRHVKTPDMPTIFCRGTKRYDFHVAWRIHYTVNVKHIDAEIDALLVQLPVNCCDVF